MFIINFVLIKQHPPSQQLKKSLFINLTMPISLLSIQLHIIERDCKSESLFRAYSVATNLVTALDF